jgi:hypothetical protein
VDWARDQLGNLLRASEPGLFGYGLSCPTCGQPVLRRAGQQRRAHFSHYSYRAKPECEHYHPAWRVSAVRSLRRTVASDDAAPGRRSLQGGIFLEVGGRDSYGLYLKLPQLPSDTGLSGEVEIRTGLGVHPYSASNLQRARLVRLLPQLPLAEVTAAAELSAVGAVITAQVSRFRASGNYFRSTDAAGRLLEAEEPLEWGERYRLLTQQSLGHVPEGLNLKVVAEGDWRDWYQYNIELPLLPRLEDRRMEETLTRYLGRVIRPPRPRIHFVDPPPHHIEPDGTHVFSGAAGRVVLVATEGSNISVEGDALILARAAVFNREGGRVEVTGLGQGSFTILLDGREELSGRFEECELFRPRGVRVTLGERGWEIFEPALGEALRGVSEQGLQIECPTVRVAERLAFDGRTWARDGRRFSLQMAPHGPTDAKNFGALTLHTRKGFETQLGTIDPRAAPRRIWLESVVVRFGGPAALIRLRERWDDEASAESSVGSEVGGSEAAWLRPHIQFARSSWLRDMP